jgi:signal transduction histidine kinase
MLRRYFGSMAGRLFLFLLVGVIGSASIALGIADMRRQADLRRIQLERLSDRIQDFISLVNSAPVPLRGEMISRGITGLRPASGEEKIERADTELTQRLNSRIGSGIRSEYVIPWSCFPRGADHRIYMTLDCRLISANLADGSAIKVVLVTPRQADNFGLPGLDPVFLLVLASGVGGLTFFAARMAAAPLNDLSRAARALGSDLNRLPLLERGPHEVRDAVRAFNAMQARLRDHVIERTHILASITHDLQTPLTRLRLKLEKVADIALRSRLIDDLDRMHALIRQGLDFSRGNQSEEPFVPLLLDSLLESVVQDAAEGGRDVALVECSCCDVEARPQALQRCLANLLENAVVHGGSAEVSAKRVNGEVHVRIRDHGPGIPPDQLEAVFDPFVRLGASPSRAAAGVGLGLTIARQLAQKNHAELVLANHPGGGLEACLILRRGVVPNTGSTAATYLTPA